MNDHKLAAIVMFLFGFPIALWGAYLSLGLGGMMLLTGWLLTMMAVMEIDKTRRS